MDAITEHHYHNIAYGKSVENEDGSLSTVKTITVEIDGVPTLIPTVWDGEIVDTENAIKFAIQSGVAWPTRTGKDAEEELQDFDKELHKGFTDQTSQEEALQILVTEFGYPETGTNMSVDGGTLTLGNDTFENGAPAWTYIDEEEPESLMGLSTSIRPKSRPTEAEQKEAFYLEKDKIQAEEWAKLNNQTPSSNQYAQIEYALGGLAASQRGITTKEGLDMANNKFQLDQKKADLDEDGELSDYEMARGEAIQKANVDNPENDEKMKMYHGGMGMMSDPVSGNPIPVGSSAENVRDDIEAMISEGEYVLPANVVKWHGLKHIMDMQSEAEMGLMGMYDTGLIQYAGEEEAEEPEEVTEAEDDIPSEEVEIEVAAVEVDDMLDEDEEVEEVFPKTSKLPGMINTPKMVFMS